jgi:acylaminoacyl-peptidase
VAAFPGLFLPAGLLPKRCWLADSQRIVITSQWRSVASALCIDVLSKRIVRLLPPSLTDTVSSSVFSLPATRVMETDGFKALVSVSAPNRVPEIYQINLPVGSSSSSCDDDKKDGTSSSSSSFFRVSEQRWPADSTIASAMYNMRWEVLQVPVMTKEAVDKVLCEHTNFDGDSVEHKTATAAASGGASLPFEAILVRPSAQMQAAMKTPPRLILWPHGGPHSGWSTDFMWSVALLVLQGHACLLINYRGSVGFGQEALASLPPRCGEQDVLDCVTALAAVLVKQQQQQQKGKQKTTMICNAKSISVWGGSHGGFLTTHCIGQYPSLFASAATRNPVTNMSAMLASTDIPDWIFCESGVQSFDETLVPTAELVASMFRKSPIAHVTRVRTPLLLLLGTADRRVPMAQGIDYYKILKMRNKGKARLLVYPGAQHSLNDRVAIEANVWINALLWLNEHYDEADYVQLE